MGTDWVQLIDWLCEGSIGRTDVEEFVRGLSDNGKRELNALRMRQIRSRERWEKHVRTVSDSDRAQVAGRKNKCGRKVTAPSADGR